MNLKITGLNYNPLYFGKKAASNISSKSEEQQEKANIQKLKATLTSLAVIGVAGIAVAAINTHKNPVLSKQNINTIGKVAANFKNGIAYNAKGEVFTGKLTKIGSLGEKFDIDIKDGIIQQSTKINSDGKIEWIKKYSKDEYKNKLVKIFIPTEEGELGIVRKIISSKDKLGILKGENEVEQFWYNTPQGFKRVDQCIDKSDITNRMLPKDYYLTNGIQINAFLRDGEFRHPDIRMDRIYYEILDDPEYPKYAKEEILRIMKDNRYILGVIDDLDILTHTSKTTEPMTVYRNAPIRWVKQAQDGILSERAFCSTSTVKGASMEGLYIGKDHKVSTTYSIHLPKGTPFMDLTNTSEKEMLLPRNGKYRVISDNELEYIL